MYAYEFQYRCTGETANCDSFSQFTSLVASTQMGDHPSIYVPPFTETQKLFLLTSTVKKKIPLY